MARPNWEFIRVDVLLPDHPKLDGLTPAAKWTLLEMWCYCGHHLTDGFVREAKWKRFGTAPIRQKLLDRKLAERVDGGYQMHDFLDHQRSRAEVVEVREKRREAGRKSAESRARAKADAEQKAQQDVEHRAEQNGSKPATEAEAEAEVLKADAVDQSADRNGRTITDLIISEIRKTTGRTVDAGWAGKIRSHILDGRSPSDPAAYVRQVIRNEPNPRNRFLPVY